MRHLSTGLILLMLNLFLVAPPCSGGVPTPVGSTTGFIKDLQPVNLTDIVLSPITYVGPVIEDIGLKQISYQGPDLADIVLDPLNFGGVMVVPVQPSSLSGNLSRTTTPVRMVPVRLPDSQPGLKILSPKPGQTVTGSVLLEVAVTGWQGTPDVDLSWWWRAPTPAGQWPAAPQRMQVVSGLNGRTRITIPASAFPKSGVWRVEATVRVSGTLKVVDDVDFTLAGLLNQAGKNAEIKVVPRPALPGTAVTIPAAGKGRLQPVAPAATDRIQE